jgi:hypothetical protein
MDPTLIAAARQLAQNPEAVPDVEAYMRNATQGKYGKQDAADYLSTINTNLSMGNIGRSMVQGATMNFGDEAMDKIPASVRSGISTGLNNAPMGIGPVLQQLTSDLGSSGADMRAKDAAFSQAHPIADFLGRGVGAAGAMVGSGAALSEIGLGRLAAKAPATVRALYAMLKGGTIGYGTGTAMDAGNQEGPKDWKAAATSFPAAAGGLLGVGIPAVAGAVGYLARPNAQGANRIGTAVRQSKSLQALRDRWQQFQDAGLGEQTTPGDLSGPLGGARKFVMQNSEEAAADAVPFFEGRQAGATGRMVQSIRKLNPEFGGAPLSNDWRQMDLKALIKSWREGPSGYDALNPDQTTVPNTNMTAKPAVAPASSPEADTHAAFAKTFNSDPATMAKNIVSQPGNAGTPAAKNAQAFLDHMGDTGSPAEPVNPPVLGKPGGVASAFAKAQQVGIIKDIPTEDASLGKLMHIKSQLSDMADQKITAGGGKSFEGFALKQAAQDLEDHMAAGNPEYLRANREYTVMKSASRTVEEGRNAWNAGDPEVLQRKMDAMTPANKLEFRRAIASDLNQQFNETGAQGNAARSILDASQQRNIGNASPATQMKLKVLFGNDDNYTKFMEHAGLEHQMAAAKSSYVGSDSYKNFKAGSNEPIAMALGGAGQTFASTGSNMAQSTIRRSIAKYAFNKLNGAAADAMHGELNTPGAAHMEAWLRSLEGKNVPSIVGTGAVTAAPTATSAGLAALKKHFAQF